MFEFKWPQAWKYNLFDCIGVVDFNYFDISKNCPEDGMNHSLVVLTFFLKDVRCHFHESQIII